MKRLFTTFFAFVALCLVACFQSSCEKEAKYTVWTENETYAEFQKNFNATLEDGYYKKIEITSEQWAKASSSLTNEGKHRWSEAEIKKWLIGCGFGEYESTKESSWLVMTDHGLLATRESNVVHLILK